MILLIDIGNSRVKWTVTSAARAAAFFSRSDRLALLQNQDEEWTSAQDFFAQRQILSAGNLSAKDVEASLSDSPFAAPVFAFLPEDLSFWVSFWASLPLERALISSVASSQTGVILAKLRALFGEDFPVQLADISAKFSGFRHLYQQNTLGIDRFLSVLAVHALGVRAAIVACAGTALTIDALLAGEFLGGTIAPGLRLMRQSLAKHAEQLDFLPGKHCDFPKRTDDAILSGCLNAMTAPILSARDRLAENFSLEKDDVLIFISGGDAAILSAHLSVLSFKINNLVLIGLARMA